MKTTPRSSRIPALLLAAAFLTLAQAADGAVLVSDNFSFGYGANVSSSTNAWTSNGGTATTIGDFTFSPVVTGGTSSAHGPLFGSRILTTAPGSNATYNGTTGTFSVTINANWAGDATTEFPDIDPAELAIRLVITEIRIYGVYYSTAAITDNVYLRFDETTEGNVQSSPTTLLQRTTVLTNLRNANYYNDVSWNPDDQWVLGTSTSRTFQLQGIRGLDTNINTGIDGFEVFGYLEVSQIPEPFTTSFLAIGAGVWVLNARRKRHLQA